MADVKASDILVDDIDSMLSQALAALSEEEVNLNEQSIFDAQAEINAQRAKDIQKMQAQKDAEGKAMMSQVKAFSKTLMHGDGQSASAPSRIKNRITSRAG